jgi:hypothetical protein
VQPGQAFAATTWFSSKRLAVLPKLASANRGQATPEENKAIVEGSLAYYGTYSVSDADKMITVHLRTKLVPCRNA